MKKPIQASLLSRLEARIDSLRQESKDAYEDALINGSKLPSRGDCRYTCKLLNDYTEYRLAYEAQLCNQPPKPVVIDRRSPPSLISLLGKGCAL